MVVLIHFIGILLLAIIIIIDLAKDLVFRVITAIVVVLSVGCPPGIVFGSRKLSTTDWIVRKHISFIVVCERILLESHAVI